MKRFVCFLLIFVLMLPAAVAQEAGETPLPFEVHISAAFGDVGEEVVVTGYVRNAPVCASYRTIFTYDTTVLEPIKEKSKSVDPEGLPIVNVNAQYQGKNAINCLAADSDMVIEGDMTLFNVTFKIIGEVEGNVSPLKLEHYEFFDGTVGKPRAKIPDSITIGKVYTSAMLEPVMTLQTLAGYDHGLHPLDVDRNGDETVSVADAVLCVRALAEE